MSLIHSTHYLFRSKYGHVRTWLSHKVRSLQLGVSLYQVCQHISDVFLARALQKPPIPAYLEESPPTFSLIGSGARKHFSDWCDYNLLDPGPAVT
jgi:hypothetical protein